MVLWPNALLNSTEKEALIRIADVLSFLGRAESWVEARILETEEAHEARRKVNCYPANVEAGLTSGNEMDRIRVLCADPEKAFLNDHTPKVKKGKGKQQVFASIYDPDWHLCLETLELHNRRWSDPPPGSRWVTYQRPKDCFKPETRPTKKIKARPNPPTVARFALDAQVLPLAEDTLKIAELMRRTAMSRYRKRVERELYDGSRPADAPVARSEVFSGKDANGIPLKDQRHAYYLPTDEDGDGRIDHVTIFAAMGFCREETAALDEMKRLQQQGKDPLNLLLLDIGQKFDIHAPLLIGPSKIWISHTPFLATRYPKARSRKRDPVELRGIENQRAFARQVLWEEMARLRIHRPELPVPVQIEPLNDEHRCGARQNLRPIQFKRYRDKRGDDGGRRAAGAFRIIFPEPVYGPICVGHSAHFGLGLFVAELRDKQS